MDKLVSTEEVDSTDAADVDSVSQIRPRVSSIVKAPTPVSPNPQHTGTTNHFAFLMAQLILPFKICRSCLGKITLSCEGPCRWLATTMLIEDATSAVALILQD